MCPFDCFTFWLFDLSLALCDCICSLLVLLVGDLLLVLLITELFGLDVI